MSEILSVGFVPEGMQHVGGRIAQKMSEYLDPINHILSSRGGLKTYSEKKRFMGQDLKHMKSFGLKS